MNAINLAAKLAGFAQNGGPVQWTRRHGGEGQRSIHLA
jgi:hypothetical protein